MAMSVTPAHAYLFLYNLAMTLGWTLLLAHLVRSLLREHSPSTIYDLVSPFLRVWQTGALLEILHAVVGIVRASASVTALQVLSRVFMIWGVCEAVPGVRDQRSMVVMIAAWALTEVPRYLSFAVGVIGQQPFWLGWLRYSTFFVLYPMGTGGEMMTLYGALPAIWQSGLFSVRLPNSWNFAFDYYWCCVALLFLYLPGLPYMYAHMIRQRRRYLKGTSTSKLKKAPTQALKKDT